MSFISAIEAAKIIGCTPGRIRQMAAAGELGRSHRLHGTRPWLISKVAAEKEAARTQEGRPGWKRGKPRKNDTSDGIIK